ncbi:MAG: hypothetical protein ACREMT_05115 [Vulcanimicrobiaceae bacterium]
MIDFTHRRKGLPRLGARLRDGDEVRILGFGGGITYEGYYLAAMARMLRTAYQSAIIETATRPLPFCTSERAVFRAREVAQMKPDLTIVEFVSEDMECDPERVLRAAEGMVRQIRFTNPDREIAFMYFGSYSHLGVKYADDVLAAWERVADHYGIPSFDGLALGNWFVEKSVGTWFDRWPGRKSWDDRNPVGLTYDGIHHTAGGGSLFGSQLAQGVIAICNPETLRTQGEMPAPLVRGDWGDAIFVPASRLSGNGWVGGPLADVLYTSAVAKWLDELSAAEREGARVRIPFEGRYAALWTFGTGGSIAATLDGHRRDLPSATDNMHHGHELLNEETSRQHVLEIEAVALPAVIAGLDLLGQVLPEVSSNG